MPGANTAGLVALATAYNDSTSTLTWMARTNDYTYAINPSTPITGCNNLKNKDTGSDLADFTQIPPYDLYKNSTTDAGYTNSWLYSQYATAYTPTATSISCGRSCTHTAAQDAYQLAIAGWNAIDNAGNTVRSQTAMNTIYIYTIGYEGDGGTDQGLLNRLANTQTPPPTMPRSQSANSSMRRPPPTWWPRSRPLPAPFCAWPSNPLRR